MFGALLTFASPVVGIDGSTASKAVALATILFSVFYLLQIWDRERRTVLLVPIGLLAGFAGAIAYRGFLGVALALGFVGYRLLRGRESVARAVVGCLRVRGAHGRALAREELDRNRQSGFPILQRRVFVSNRERAGGQGIPA